MKPKQLTAVEWLRDLHYQICNGGMQQACYNGYIDNLIDTYGSVDAWVDALREELGDTEAGDKAVKAASLIANGVSQIHLSKSCRDCGGSGYLMFEEEDEDGEINTVEETCSECGGYGIVDADNYSDVDLDSGFFPDNWDSEYYALVDSDFIDDLTGQSHNHSVIMDMMEHASKS